MSADAPAPAADAKSGGGFLKMAVAVGLTAVLSIGGVWWWTSRTADAAAEAPTATRGIVTLEPFVVNLTDGDGRRFLRASLSLLVEPEEDAAAISQEPVVLTQLRSLVLELLAQQTAVALVTPEGKTAAKAAILAHASEVTGKKVVEVLFGEFVVQF